MCNLCENIEEKKLPKEGGREREREKKKGKETTEQNH